MQKEAIIVTDLGYGDAGKGTIVDFLTREKKTELVVRFNGGAQAAHNVVTPDGRHHTFSQFGSGTLVNQDTLTYLSGYMMVNPLNMFNEASHLESLGDKYVWDGVHIDEHALIITPYHQAINRLKEISRGPNNHGSCGLGIGETMADSLKFNEEVLRVGDLTARSGIRDVLEFTRDLQLQKFQEIKDKVSAIPEAKKEIDLLHNPNVMDRLEDLYDRFASNVEIGDELNFWELMDGQKTVIFEGAQGILLDQKYGFQPYTTWSNTTFENAKSVLNTIKYRGKKIKLGVIRAYSTRHGSGPFLTEDKSLSQLIPDIHNQTNTWQQNFRIGFLDLVATRYAIDVCHGIDGLAVTNLDRLDKIPEWKTAISYKYNGKEDLSEFFEHHGDKITSIKVDRKTDFNKQSRLTELLADCTPEYQTFPSKNRKEYLKFLENYLNTQVNLISFGLTADEKEFLK